MRLICIFMGNKLLEHSDYFHRETAYYLKDNVSTVTGLEKEELDAFYFEDPDLKQYMQPGSNMPKKFVEITRGTIKLFDLIDAPETVETELDWKNCSDDMLGTYFTEAEIIKINENKAYYEALGSEKYDASYQIQWPHVISKPIVEMTKSKSVPQLYKEIVGELIETPEPVIPEPVYPDEGEL